MTELFHPDDHPDGEMPQSNMQLKPVVSIPVRKELTESQIAWRLTPLAAGVVIALLAVAMEPKPLPWGIVSLLIAAALGAISFFSVVPYLPGNQPS